MGGSNTKQRRKRALSMGAGDSNRLAFKTNSIGDDYSMIKSIGEGANGKVFMCQSKYDKKKYALKVFFSINFILNIFIYLINVKKYIEIS